MPRKMGLDTCDWCGSQTNSIQTNGSVWLCPSCCPSLDEAEVPENAPPSWHHMSDAEKQDWKNGLSMEEIMEKHSWHVPPEPPAELVH